MLAAHPHKCFHRSCCQRRWDRCCGAVVRTFTVSSRSRWVFSGFSLAQAKATSSAPFLVRVARVHVCCINRKTKGQLVRCWLSLFTSSCSRTPRTENLKKKKKSFQSTKLFFKVFFFKAGFCPFKSVFCSAMCIYLNVSAFLCSLYSHLSVWMY